MLCPLSHGHASLQRTAFATLSARCTAIAIDAVVALSIVVQYHLQCWIAVSAPHQKVRRCLLALEPAS